MNIGERLKIARNAIGYTLEKASQESGIGQSSISEFENYKREPKFSQLSKLAKVYRRTVEFFLSNEPFIEEVMLWRYKPDEEQRAKIEAEFRKLCEQYHRLEVLTDEVKEFKLPKPDLSKPEEFTYRQAELFAKEAQKWFRLGDVPIASLKRILEEVYYIKIFYIEYVGSSISTVSDQFGPAILLNTQSKQWRRSYDLAHELFHILAWRIFRNQCVEPSDFEEKLADAFASRFLMPEESIRDRVESKINNKQISFDQLDDIAREFDVSLEALIYRIASIYRFEKEDTERYIDTVKKYIGFLKPRPSYKPNILPERYCDLAQRALREGKLSLMQFAKYMGISYKDAEEYLTDDEGFKDKNVSISIA
ncbi:MAG: XRE family transcriptional regulator [Sedimentisphaerales bacterium]|nr:XRE family transcriptional regulator [Sedimentisphaerales bacterium]